MQHGAKETRKNNVVKSWNSVLIMLIISLELTERLLHRCSVDTLIMIAQRRRAGTRERTLQLFKWQVVTIKWWPISSYKQQTAGGKRQSSRCPGSDREGLVEPQRGGNSSGIGWWRRGDAPVTKTDFERIKITWSGQRKTIIRRSGLQIVTIPGDTRSG